MLIKLGEKMETTAYVNPLETLVLSDKCDYDKLPKEENLDAVVELIKQKDALLLVHTYQRPEIHEIGKKLSSTKDTFYVGDSYGLSIAAQKTDKPLIVFCGVHFMAETAKILNPDKRVLLPSLDAGCGLADSITAEGVRKWKAQYPGIPLVLYINSSASVKAEADVICTSSNTLKAIESMPTDKVLLAPDKNLYYNFQSKTKKVLIPWEGYCPVHKLMNRASLERAMQDHPAAEVVVHPECNPEVTQLADVILSTSGMVNYVQKSNAKEFIIGTEHGLIEMLKTMFPDKHFYAVTNAKSCDESCVCPFMKSITLGKVRRALEQDIYEINVSDEIRRKALIPIERMVALGRDT